MINKQGNVLLWNGEIFDSNNKHLQIQRNQNDGQVLFEALSEVEDDVSVPSLLQDIKGPWAIIYWQVCSDISCPSSLTGFQSYTLVWKKFNWTKKSSCALSKHISVQFPRQPSWLLL